MISRFACVLSLGILQGLSHAAFAEASSGNGYPTSVYWGDTHLHTSYSMDANYAGLVELGPADAYRFAKGEVVEVVAGVQASINRPLDFLVVTDHAEYLGLIRRIRAGDPELLKDPEARRWHQLIREGGAALQKAFRTEGGPQVEMPEVKAQAWQDIVTAAEAANRPGSFTALAGFEWSSTPNGNNLHRNVIFRDGPDRTLQVMPFSFHDSERPEDLWRYLQRYEEKTDGQVLAIPHNSNLSGGLMFPENERNGEPMTAATARLRARWEPVVEVTQIKGDSETHPLLSPNDGFADYGTWDKANIVGTEPQQPWMFPYQYTRSALKTGLAVDARVGVNPYHFGMIGSSDSHIGISAVEENNYWGKMATEIPSPDRAGKPWSKTKVATVYAWEELASGYAAVWARANTREEIFDALKRREVYATTGPRITVRFFGGWQFEADDISRSDFSVTGYQKGVPMGSTLALSAGPATAPTFMVVAMKDPQGANLDRVQIVKGWLDAEGETHEKVYDVAWSGHRQPDSRGRLPLVGNTVDLENANYSNTIGAAQLATVWEDPDFDPAQSAFYYVRVLEIPTPRWTLYDKSRLGAKLPENVPLIHQERAYSSPIWYDAES